MQIGFLGLEDPWSRSMATLQDSCLEIPLTRKSCWATFHMVTKTQTQMATYSTHARSGSSGPYG